MKTFKISILCSNYNFQDIFQVFTFKKLLFLILSNYLVAHKYIFPVLNIYFN